MAPRIENRSIPAEFPWFLSVHRRFDRCSTSLGAGDSSVCIVGGSELARQQFPGIQIPSSFRVASRVCDRRPRCARWRAEAPKTHKKRPLGFGEAVSCNFLRCREPSRQLTGLATCEIVHSRDRGRSADQNRGRKPPPDRCGAGRPDSSNRKPSSHWPCIHWSKCILVLGMEGCMPPVREPGIQIQRPAPLLHLWLPCQPPLPLPTSNCACCS
jgi:hypothetical protein